MSGARPTRQARLSKSSHRDGLARRLCDTLTRERKRADYSPNAQEASSADDRWQRRGEYLFEHLAVRCVISDLPLEGQKELLGRYRMASTDERRWVRETIEMHLERHHPELDRG